ncbi:MAG: hypothetical protein WED00_00285 [Aquisalimonadaceae bacterium]
MSKIEEAMQRLEAERALRGSSLPLDGKPWGGGLQETASTIARMCEPRLRTHDELDHDRIICPGGRNPRAVNAFRQLRTSLLRHSENRNFVLLVSGVGRRAGASFAASNLAAAFALDETMTALLIDCNLSRPDTSRLVLDAEEQEPAGLTDLLEGEVADMAHVIHPTGIPRLRVMPVGSRGRHVREFFTSKRLPVMFRELASRYPDRYIILDAPPIDESADARILANLSNMVLLVVPYGRVTAVQIESAVAAIPGDRYVGSIVNNEPA